MAHYLPSEIEPKWQQFWRDRKTFKTTDDTSKPKYYVLDMFPYPSGSGLHVGHPEGYTATDIIARYKRMQGFNVLHPMGWDAFGLPAEQYAVQTGTHPSITTRANIKRFREQIDALGLSYDWDREIDTTDPSYYKWTQWIFTKLHEKGLAYESSEPVNWCPALGTVLANEEVIDGKSERGGHPVEKKPMRQWVLKITAYAERLLQDLDLVDWPDSIKEMQRHWIGKSTGARIRFEVDGTNDTFHVFTTRADTLFGVTFFVLAPEHTLVKKITTKEQETAVTSYIAKAKNRSDRDRLADQKEKTGVFTGSYAINPANGRRCPIYIADYVLASYGEGAIMGVPAHDERDLAFAEKFSLPVITVIENGKMIASEILNDLSPEDATTKIIAWLEAEKIGDAKITYKLRDWLFSRQRYWGEPFPVLHDDSGNVRIVTELPVKLPNVEKFQPTSTGDPPLAQATDWLKVSLDGKTYTRETNTMPNWAGSCWYYLRFIDPKNDHEAWSRDKERYWMPVDLYIGGAEHAVLHLLYARFWHKVLFDLGYVSTPEPFKKLVNQGMILGENGEKMSKSRGNVVNPDDVVKEWGADSLRLYEMFMGPLEAVKPWQSQAIPGVHRFLKRAYRLIINEDGTVRQGAGSENIEKALHKLIHKVGSDIETLSFNTAIAAMMEFVNLCYKEEAQLTKSQLERFTLVLSPFAPHIGEELWNLLGHEKSLCYEPWPKFDPALTKDDTVTVSIQVNGKLRGTLSLSKSVAQEDAVAQALQIDTVKKQLEGKEIRKTIYVAQKIINFVV